MESTSQRYATFLRQWKKRHSCSQLHNQYHKYERLPQAKDQDPTNVYDLKKAPHETDCKKRSLLNGSTKESPLTFKNNKLLSLPHRDIDNALRSPVEACGFPTYSDLLQNHKELNNVTTKLAAGLFHDKKPQPGRFVAVHPQFLNNPRQKKLPRLEPRKNFLKTNIRDPLIPFVSPAELADMEFWLLYGENAQSAASHFSYALLARIDQLTDVPKHTGNRFPTMKTTLERRKFPHTYQRKYDLYDGPSFNFLKMCQNVPRQKDRTPLSRKMSSVYLHHNSDCADKYRLHILKVMKKIKQLDIRKDKNEIAETFSQDLKDTKIEVTATEDKSDDVACVSSNGIAARSSLKSVFTKDKHNRSAHKACDIIAKDADCREASTVDDNFDANPKKKTNPCNKQKNRRILIASKVQLNPSTNSKYKEKSRSVKDATRSTSSLVATLSSASTRLKQNCENSSKHACVPSAGSSVTVYLPRCPLEPVTTSFSEENSGLSNETTERIMPHQKCEFREADEISHIGHTLTGEVKFNENLNEEEVLHYTADCSERQDIISVSIRMRNKPTPEHSQAKFASENLAAKLQSLDSASGLDSSRKCNQWLFEKCPK